MELKYISTRLRRLIRPYYLRIFKGRSYIEAETKYRMRNWKMDINLPDEIKTSALESILHGKVDFKYNSKFSTAVLFAMPKSASLYIIQLLASSLNYENHQIGFNEQGGSIYYPRLLMGATAQHNTISHCHAEPTNVVLKYINNFNIHPIVLYRNLLDVIVSRRDMLLKDKFAGNFLSEYANKQFINSSEEHQFQVVIDLFANEYLNFYTSWRNLRTKLKIHYINYNELIENEISMVQRVGEFLGCEVSEENILKVSESIRQLGGINFNQGVRNRGKQLLSDEHIDRLREKARMFDCSDEEFLGFQD